MKFCSECAHPVSLQIPPDDNRPRFVCGNCGAIHYQNPKMVVGYWTLPAGFMENGETTTDAAQRETEEEAGAHIKLGPLFSLINVPHVHQVHLFYLAELLDLDYCAGTESLEVAMFREADIPWSEIAFPTVAYTLRAFFAALAKVRTGDGGFGLHTDDIRKSVIQTD
jgi:ADP-ribose pyrophosphatase YjhB (NUDIX family)